MNISIALALSALTAATAFVSMALASSAVPNLACANAAPAIAIATTASAPIVSLRSIGFLLSCFGADSLTLYHDASMSEALLSRPAMRVGGVRASGSLFQRG